VDWDAIGSRSPSGRVGKPEDIAGLAMFLSSQASAYINGHTIPCDGGIVSAS
jgi:NAD(P)-dependent dehydrogenase (short-subunit alcohol dehydrogenase family)